MNEKQYTLASLAIVLLAAGLRFYNLGGTSLWFDEAVYATNSQGSFSEMLEKTRTRNSSPILLPLILWLLGDLVQSPFWIRFLPAVFGTLTVIILLLMPKVGVPQPVALFSSLWMSFLPAQIHYSQEVREYSLSSLIGAIMIYLFFKMLKNQDLKNNIPFAIILFIAPLSAYGTIFLGGILLVILIILEIRSPQPKMSKYALPITSYGFGMLTSYYTTAKSQMGIARAWYFENDYPPGDFGPAISWFLKAVVKYFSFQYGGILPSHGGIVSAIFCGAAMAGFLFFILKKRIFQNPDSFLVLTFCIVIFTSIVISAFGLYPFGGLRQHMFATPLAVLAAVSAIFSLIKDHTHKKPLTALFFVILVLPGCIFGLPVVYREQQNITSPVHDIPKTIHDSKAFVYYGAVPAVRFHFPERKFYLSQVGPRRLAEMESEIRMLGSGPVGLVFAHMLFYEDQELLDRLLNGGYILLFDRAYEGWQDGYPGSRLVILEKKIGSAEKVADH